MSDPRNLFMIVGPQGAGKSTFGKMLAEELKTGFSDTSDVLVQLETARQRVLRERYKIMNRVIVDDPQVRDTSFPGWDEDKNRPTRELLVALGEAVNNVSPSFLTLSCFERGRVAAGMRGRSELKASRSLYCGYIKIVYIDREPGPEVSIDRLELTPADADYVVRAKTLEEAKYFANLVANWTF